MWRRLFIALVVCSVGLSAYGAYGLSAFDPAHLEKLSETTFVPVNGSLLRLNRPGEAPLFFERDADDPEHVLVGLNPWLGELDGRVSRVMTDPEFRGGQTGFMFVDGYLRGLLVKGREYKIPAPVAGTNATAVAALWPEPSLRRRQDQAPDIWGDGSRLRLWFDNPNKAGLLFAELALAFLALLSVRRLWVRVLGGGCGVLAFGCLLWTSSRGGFLALLCGLAVLGLLCARKLATKRNLAILGMAFLLAAGALAVSGQGGRLVGKLFSEERTTEAQRATSRLTIWREVPRMIADAPGGWGAGKSAEAYIDWYQKESTCLLKDMISGHLTFLVEHGWFGRLAYLSLWAFLLLFALVRGFKGGSPYPAAVGTAFFVAACFNPVVGEWTLWLLPLGFAVPVARMAVRRESARQAAGALVAAVLCVGLAVAGIFMAARGLGAGALSVVRDGDAVLLNGTSPAVWLVDDDYVLHGGFWWLRGAEIRGHLGNGAEGRAVGYARDLDAVPPDVERLVLVGESGRAFLDRQERPRAKEIVFLSPPFTWHEVPDALRASCRVSLVCGAHAARVAGVAKGDAPDWVRIVPGAELYIPDWTKVLSM